MTKAGPLVTKSLDSFKCRKTMKVGDAEYEYFSLTEAEKNGLTGIAKLPFSMKVLLENLLRNEDGRTVSKEDIEAVRDWVADKGTAGKEIAYRPARVLMQDFTGVPAVVDLAAMRDAIPLPEMGSAGVQELPRRAARHRHLPSGQPRISRPDRLDEGRGRHRHRLS